jgi:flavin-dependent dehydrogenase
MVEMIRILGGGIAGLTAAINLAKNGQQVIVYESLSKVGMKFKPNCQLFGNWDTKEDIITTLEKYNIKINYQTKLESIEFHPPNLKHKAEVISDTRPVGYTVIRGGENSFECYLEKQAKKEDVKIVTNFKKKIKPNIIATGCKKTDAVGYGGIFKGNFDVNTAIILFDYNYAPGGYSYLLPHSKKIATLAVAMKPWDNPKKLFQKLIEHPLYKEQIRDSEMIYKFSGITNFKIPKTAVDKDSLLIGETAGFQDAAFGFGMRYAIASGYLASKSILEKLDYDKLWKKTFLNELKKTKLIRTVLDKSDNEFLNKLISAIGKRSIDDFADIWASRKKAALFYFKTLLQK